MSQFARVPPGQLQERDQLFLTPIWQELTPAERTNVLDAKLPGGVTRLLSRPCPTSLPELQAACGVGRREGVLFHRGARSRLPYWYFCTISPLSSLL